MSNNGQPKYLPLQYKLLISYVLLVIVPVTIIGSYAYLSSASALERSTLNNMEIAVGQIASNVQYRVDDVSRSARELYEDQVLSRYLSGYYLDWERYQITTQYVLPRLESAAHLPKQKVRVTVYLDEKTLGEYYYNETEYSLETGDRKFEILYTDRIAGESWYRSLRLPFDEYTWKQIGSDAAYGYASLLQPLINYETFQSIGLIRVSVKLNDIFEDVDLNELGEGTRLLVLDDRSELLYVAQHSADINTSVNELLSDSRFMQIRKEIGHFPAELVALIPVESFKENSEKVRNATILICLLSVLVLTFISVLIARMFSRRMNKLILSLQAFKEGEYTRRIHYKGRDEFADIADSFNDMASTTQRLIDEVYVSRLEKKEAELQILHSQINPHFLYNTFSSISRMAKLGEIGKLHEIIRELAKFYRLTLNKGEMLITIEKELQIIEAYLNIQNLKNGGRIKSSINCEPGIEKCETVKFVLQPFVENVLEHAWYDDEIEVMIRVSRGSGGLVLMEVEDNGLGVKPETLAALSGRGKEQVGYGISNVDQRIKLHYGKQYGVAIKSEVGRGTLVTIQIPEIVSRLQGDE